MSTARLSLLPPQVVVEHTSSAGPVVTHVRGTLIAGSRDNLRDIGVYDQYVEELPSSLRERLLYAIPTSWVPIEDALAHYNTCELLKLDSTQIARLGELTASRVIDTFLGKALRMAQNAGADSFWLLIKQNDRIYDRMYQGGGVRVLKTGPKDLIVENHGMPLAECRYWRMAYVAYMEALGRAFAKVSFIKLVRPSVNDPHRIAVAGSWV